MPDYECQNCGHDCGEPHTCVLRPSGWETGSACGVGWESVSRQAIRPAGVFFQVRTMIAPQTELARCPACEWTGLVDDCQYLGVCEERDVLCPRCAAEFDPVTGVEHDCEDCLPPGCLPDKYLLFAGQTTEET
jgi:hypothetical protein